MGGGRVGVAGDGQNDRRIGGEHPDGMGVGVREHVPDISVCGSEIAGGGEEREGGLMREVGGEVAQGALGALEPAGQGRGLLLPGLVHELRGFTLFQLADQEIGRKKSGQ